MNDKFGKVIAILITISLWVIVLQNFGILKPVSKSQVIVLNTVDIQGSVNVDNTVDVSGYVSVDNTVDVNLDQVVGYALVASEKGMYIGVNSTENTVIPIHWGAVSND
jgi:hypothetical protein